MSPPTAAQTFPHRPDIDGLRGLAVGAVVLFHLDPTWVPGGFVGVDIFFVISGFLITRLILQALEDGRFTFSRFYARRARRILPALLATIVLALVFGFLLLSPAHFERLAQTSLYASLAVSNFFFFGEAGYFDTDASLKPLLHTWSLGVEEQFYLFWPALLWAVHRRRPAALLPVVIGCALLSLAASEAMLALSPSASFYLLPFRVFELALGAVLVWAGRRRKAVGWQVELMLVAALLLMLGSIALYDGDTAFPGLHALVPCAGAALAIHAGERSRLAWLLRNAVAKGLGRISYSLYLVHWPLFVFAAYANFGPLDLAQKGVALVAALALAAAMHRFVETPIRERGGGTSQRAPAVVGFAFTGAVAALMLLCAHVWAQQGWPWRVPESLRIASSVDADEDRAEGGKSCIPVRNPHKVSMCRFGAEPDGAYDFVLMGDSHGEHFVHGLDRIFDDARVSGLWLPTGDNNVPLRGGTFIRGGSPKGNDREYAALEGIDYRNVILASRWHLYWNTTSHDWSQRRIYAWGMHRGDEVGSSRLALDAALAHTVEYFRSRGKGVFVIGQVPPFGPDINLCVERPDYLVAPSRERCGGFAPDEIRAIAKRSDGILAARAEALGFEFVNLTDAICADTCTYIVDGTYLYRDDDHVSRFGSEVIARRVLRDALLGAGGVD